tara:strand:- start:275 stop:586 length:312 start_codon:yes stop_codon:yes gene_type:complete
MNGKYIVTTDAWFTAKDGCQYKAVWGNVEILDDAILGVKTNRNASNWFAKVGGEDNHVIVAGCQIHYAVKCEERPNTEMVNDWQHSESGVNMFNRPTYIYIAE